MRRDGSALPVSWVLTPVQTPEGDSSVIVITDNTQARIAQQRLRRDVEQFEQVREVHEALEEQRFELFAQASIELSSGATVSHELLLRMVERDGTIRAPSSFLPAAEYSGSIHELDRWVIGEAARLAGAGHQVALNLSADSFGDPGVAEHLVAALTEHGANPARIVVELTETALITDDGTVGTFYPADPGARLQVRA
ncbi:MAG: EAL domain-containing protein [Solirubrobacteraceae bacterium]